METHALIGYFTESGDYSLRIHIALMVRLRRIELGTRRTRMGRIAPWGVLTNKGRICCAQTPFALVRKWRGEYVDDYGDVND